MEFEGDSERRTLIASQYEQYEDMTPEGIVKKIMSLIGNDHLCSPAVFIQQSTNCNHKPYLF